MNFVVFSRNAAADAMIDIPHIHISLGFEEYDFPVLKENEKRLAHLKLQCEDTDTNSENSFQQKHAKELLDLVKKYHDVPLIVVNCVAGQSRSAGTAAALAKIITNDDSKIVRQKPSYNRWIYRNILNCFEENYDEFQLLMHY